MSPMREILVIGIGPGDPEQITLQAIRLLNEADLILIPRKGLDKSDLADLRREICARHLTNPATRIVEYDMPVRDEAGGYRAGVAAWHREIAAIQRRAIEAHSGPEARAALLVWGDPSLYDSTLRILDLMAESGLAFSRRVAPGVTSLQALAARHGVPLNAVGGEVAITTGRRLREGAPAAGTVAVMLDGGGAFATLDGADWDICWGAYLGMPQEIALAGPLDEMAGRIAAVRAEARAAHGWIMDAYLLKRRTRGAEEGDGPGN